jgi:hypothetical protein
MSASFWWLEAPSLRGLAEAGPGIKFEPFVCPVDETHDGLGKRISNPSVILPASGVKDFTWTWGGDIFISQRVLDLFKKYRVTGFEVRPARTAYPKAIKAQPPQLFELVVTGWGGFAARGAGMTLVEWCPGCVYKRYAIKEPSRAIDHTAWDGSDLFIVWPMPRFRFASNRLATILREERVSGVKLIPAAEVPIERGARLGPGSVAHHMPERRARELEARFDVAHWLEPARRSRA